MTDLQSEFAKIMHSFVSQDGMVSTPVPGVHCIKLSQTDRRSKKHWRTSFAIMAQGCKEIVLGREVYRYEVGHYTVTPIDLPVISRIAAATPEKPFLALLIDFDPRVLNEIAAPLEKDFPKEFEIGQQAMFVGKANDKMLEAAVRLAKLFRTPEDAPVLGPLIVRELYYHLLRSENGPAIHQFVRSGSKMHKVSQMIHKLRLNLSGDVDVAALAKAASMSRSAFFKHFKDLTAVSPIQYQKRLRLLEARRLMTDEGETAEGSAYKVGYKSASQFSREYSRMFGNSPLRDAVKIKRTGRPLQQI